MQPFPRLRSLISRTLSYFRQKSAPCTYADPPPPPRPSGVGGVPGPYDQFKCIGRELYCRRLTFSKLNSTPLLHDLIFRLCHPGSHSLYLLLLINHGSKNWWELHNSQHIATPAYPCTQKLDQFLAWFPAA